MARTLVALFDDLTEARDAVHELTNNGFSRDDISLIANNTGDRYGRLDWAPHSSNSNLQTGTSVIGTNATITSPTATDVPRTEAGKDAGIGAGVGAVLGGIGGLLVGLGALAVPGVGPVVAAGPIAAALVGAGIGAAGGGLIGALVGAGIPNEDAGVYAEGIRRGGTLVTVHTTPERADDAARILNRHGPIDIDERVTAWRSSGWTGYRDDDTHWTQDRIDQERQRYRGTDTTPGLGASSTHWSSRQVRVHHRDTGASSMGTGSSGYGYGQGSGNALPASSGMGIADVHVDVWRQHWKQNYSAGGGKWDDYAPAYAMGADLRRDKTYRDYDWNRIEPEARLRWDRSHGTKTGRTWEEVKAAVRHAWDWITPGDDTTRA